MASTNTAVLILMGGFLLLALLRVPVVYAIGTATMATFIYLGIDLSQMALKFAAHINSYSLLAVPFFILMGEILGVGGISERLIELSQALVGWIRGGLAMVNIVASIFFGGISGSSSADCASIGPILIPLMEKDGYDRDFSTAVTMASSVQGILIPPSQNMVIFALAATGVCNVSLGQMFVAGYVPGLMLAFALMIYCAIVAKKRSYPISSKFSIKNLMRALGHSIWALLTIFIVVIGVVAGLFTTTESAAFACIWAVFVAVAIYKEVNLKTLISILSNVVKMIGKILILMGTCGAFSYLLTYLRIPDTIAKAVFSVTDNKIIILLLLNIMMLIMGMFVDMGSLLLILTPIILPMWIKMGYTPIHLAIVMILNLGIGLLTPPVGSTLFIGSAVSGVPIEKLSKSMIPFYIVMIVVLLIITFIPSSFLWLPSLFY